LIDGREIKSALLGELKNVPYSHMSIRALAHVVIDNHKMQPLVRAPFCIVPRRR